jgi:hypothetical protein
VELSQGTIIKGAAAGVTVLAATKFGVIDRIPSVGGVNRGIVLVALGFALAIAVRPGGTLNDVTEGAGFGLIALGALHMGA